MAIADSSPPPPGVTAQDDDPPEVASGDLRAGSIGLAGVLMQSVAQISPTLGIFYTIAFNTGQAGRSAPLTYLAAFVICLVISVPMTSLARHLPSAGGLYTYVARGIVPRWGFITGWLYAIMVTVVPAALAAFTGAVLHDELDAKYGFGVPWWAYALVFLAICLACAYRGIVISVRFLVAMSVLEICVGLGLSLTGIVNPGPGGINAQGFNPAHIGSSSGFFLAIVLSIFAFTGFESAAAVGEESRDPKRLVPTAIAGSLVLIGAFYVFCAWGLQVGWGTDHLNTLADSPTAPAFVLADRLWSGGSIIVLIALVNSGLGVCIACTTSSTRTIYGMARTGALPTRLATVSRKHRTPVAAIVVQTAVAVTVALAVGLPLGPYNLFNMLGTTGTFVYIPIFILMNVAAFKFFRDKHREEFRILPLVIAPVISTAALVTIGYKSIVPLPASPVNYAPAIVAGYLLLGALVLFGRNLRAGRRGWMARAGQLPDID
jgi:amino acid transporter